MSWLSKKLGLDKAKKKGTGIYSWGKTAWVENAVSAIPGVGNAINAGLDVLSDQSDKAKAIALKKSRKGTTWIHIS